MSADHHERAVACPYCGAKAGERCRSFGGAPLTTGHAERRRLALDEEQANVEPAEVVEDLDEATAADLVTIVDAGGGEVSYRSGLGPLVRHEAGGCGVRHYSIDALRRRRLIVGHGRRRYQVTALARRVAEVLRK